MRARALLPLAALATAAGCVYSPAGQCTTAADCGAGYACTEGVCTVAKVGQGGGQGGRTLPAPAIAWAARLGQASTTFRIAGVGATASGDVAVSGDVDAPYDFGPGPPAAGQFVVMLGSSSGTASWADAFSFARVGGASLFRTAVAPGGTVFFAGTALDPVTVGSVAVSPGPRGTLVVGALGGALGDPLWIVTAAGTGTSGTVAPAALAVSAGGDLLVGGTGRGDLGCGDTAQASFVARLSSATGACVWSKGLQTRTLSDVEPRPALWARAQGDAVVAGACTPASSAAVDVGAGVSCTGGLYLMVLDAENGTSVWSWNATGSFSSTFPYDVAVSPASGRIAVAGDATGLVSFGAGTVDLGASASSFVALWDGDAAGTLTRLLRPAEAPLAASSPDALAITHVAFDPAGRLWTSGRWSGAPALAGGALPACRAPDCLAGGFVASIDAAFDASTLAAFEAAGLGTTAVAYVGDQALSASAGGVVHAFQWVGAGTVAGLPWTSAGIDLGVVRITP